MKNLKTLLAATVTLMMAAQLQAGDIVDVAASNKSFKTLVAAVKAAGLVETLKSDGPFTVLPLLTKLLRSCPRELSKAC